MRLFPAQASYENRDNMDFIISIIRTLFRHRWIIILIPLIVGSYLYYSTRHMRGGYDVKATLYTGVASGYSLENDNQTDLATVQNSMDNLISIIQAESTLKRVSLRLFARVLMKGNSTKEVDWISPASYVRTYEHVKNSPDGKKILSLIDKTSEDKSVANLEKYMTPHQSNYVYGLFYYTHPYYSYNALKNIKVQRRLTSDLLDVSYTSGDAGIAYLTVSILMSEFVDEYRRIRYGETDKVIEFFRKELKRIGDKLNHEEDELTKYNVEKRIINYTDETKEIAAINKEFELREQNALFDYNSTKLMLEELEKHMDSNAKQVINNLKLVDKLKEATVITGKISEVEVMSDTKKQNSAELETARKQLSAVKGELNKLTDAYIGHQYTKEGTARTNIVDQWLEQTLLFEKAKAELQVIQNARQELNDRYVFYAPVGTTIKQKERLINFTEQNYLTVLKSYNDALLRKKNLEMTSATLKVLNEPTYPITTNATNRKQIVIGATIGAFVIIIALLLLIEMLDRTLRDPSRTRRVTKISVLGAIPNQKFMKFGRVSLLYLELAVNELTNSILRYLTQRKSSEMYIINLFSTTGNGDEIDLSKAIHDNLENRKLKTGLVVYGTDFNTESAEYLLAKEIKDFYTPKGEDILIVVYPPLSKSSIPSALLANANLNILVAPADCGWKTIDKQLCEQLTAQMDSKVPLRICLTRAGRIAIEDFTGLLPPFTLWRRLTYRLGQLSLTERIRLKEFGKKKAKVVEDEDDDE